MEATLLGLSFGLAAGLSPGPLLTLVVQSALRRGFASGARVAIAPLLTDAPVIALSLLALGRVPDRALQVLAVVGGIFVIHLGVESIRYPDVETSEAVAEISSAREIRRAFVVNLLSPHPWVFWATVGGPILIEAWNRDRVDAVGFLAAFFALLVGLKVLFAGFVSAGRGAMGSRGHRIAIQLSGLLLVGLGIVLAYQGLAGAPGSAS